MRYAPYFLTMAQVIPVLLLALLLEWQRLVVPLPKLPRSAGWWRKRLYDFRLFPLVALLALAMGTEFVTVKLAYDLSLPGGSEVESPTPQIEATQGMIMLLVIAASLAIAFLPFITSEQFRSYATGDTTQYETPVEEVLAPPKEPTKSNARLLASAAVGALVAVGVASATRRFRGSRRT